VDHLVVATIGGKVDTEAGFGGRGAVGAVGHVARRIGNGDQRAPRGAWVGETIRCPAAECHANSPYVASGTVGSRVIENRHLISHEASIWRNQRTGLYVDVEAVCATTRWTLRGAHVCGSRVRRGQHQK